MPKTEFVDFKAVKSQLTMEQVLRQYGLFDRFKRSGDSLSGPCPIHKGSNPTQFRVSLSKNVWNCFSECQHGGNTLDFIARMENTTIHAAALKAIEWFNLTVDDASEGAEEVPQPFPAAAKSSTPPPIPTNTAPAPEPNTPNAPLKFRLDKLDASHPYLAERGLTPETIQQFGLGYCAKGLLKGHIAIPIHNRAGSLVAYAGRWPGSPPAGTPKYKLPPGFRKSLELFHYDLAMEEPADTPLMVVEGFFDCLKLWQLGARKTVALMGRTLSTAQEELIRSAATNTKHILLMLDEDEAGRAGRTDIAARLARHAYVKIHAFEKEGSQPEDLTRDQLAAILGH